MDVNGIPYRTIWPEQERGVVRIIDQTRLPHELVIAELRTLDDAVRAIREMWVRGAPLIGATAAYGICLALAGGAGDQIVAEAGERLLAARPTAVNLRWGVERMRAALAAVPPHQRPRIGWQEAAAICDEDVAANRSLGEHGAGLIEKIWHQRGDGPVQILTHCNAGWLATVDWGTALAPVYVAHQRGIPLHVWVDETRPRNQGAHLTAWELAAAGIPHHLIADNAGGHLMQQGKVDLCLVGTDRTTAGGDVCNKIGTYLKALAARDNGVPFYVALPGSTIDWRLRDGAAIPIEERDQDEVLFVQGRGEQGVARVRIAPARTPAANPAFDVTPARLVTGLITERGICPASEQGLRQLYPEQRQNRC